MKQVDLREGARRQDRAVALYATIQCWVRGLDGVAFRRDHLLRLLGLERFKATRVKWLKEDMKELFPHVMIFTKGQNESLDTLIVSRKPLLDKLYTVDQQLMVCKNNRNEVGYFELWQRPKFNPATSTLDTMLPFFVKAANPDDLFLAAYISLIASGQISPLTIPNIVTINKI